MSWAGVGYVDNYYQTEDLLKGREIPGSANLNLSARVHYHSDIHQWYYYTINTDTFPVSDNWFAHFGDLVECAQDGKRLQPFQRTQDGFHFSRIGRGEGDRCPEMAGRVSSLFDWEGEGIVNGDFERGYLDQIPGWEANGGGGTGFRSQTYGDGSVLYLDDSHSSRTHNRFYVPPHAKSVCFRYRVIAADADDTLQVKVGTHSKSYSLANATVWIGDEIDVTSYRGDVILLSFEIIKNGQSSSVVNVDDVSFVVDGPEAVITSPGPGNTLSTSSPTFRWTAGAGVSRYWLQIGTTPGGKDLYDSINGTAGLYATVSGMRADGIKIYVTLWSKIGDEWRQKAYVYNLPES